MPSTTRALSIFAVAAGISAVLYSFFLAFEPLLGLGVGVACFTVAVLLYAGGTNRETVAAVTMGATVVYGVFTLQFPTAVVAACVVYLTLWVTDEDGPFDASPPTIIPEGVVDGSVESDERAEPDEAAE
jgi:branched-subunit amino acid ABC-type transport system permease component